MSGFWGDTRSWLIAGCIAGGAIILSLIAHRIVFFFLDRFSRKRQARFGQSFVQRAWKPALFVFPLMALVVALPAAPFPTNFRVLLQRVLGLGVIAAVGWAIILLVELLSDMIYYRYAIDVADNLSARRIRTQTAVLNRIAVVVVVLVTVAIMLMTFPEVRHIGISLLASAGLAGLVVGMAARSTLASLIAGIQIAMTQPIRIEDALVIEGEWGWVEEIGMTYVIIRIWDLRRLVVPLTYFIEKPFANWTRTSSELLGVVMLYADYSLPVEEARQELYRLLEASDLWDRKTWGLQVTDATEKTVQLRALMSAANGSRLWDLRCYAREGMIRYINSKHPGSLPLVRGETSVSMRNGDHVPEHALQSPNASGSRA
ncbi:MAG: mechanosensitive ion channel domain-containing protein [Candidatus Acidiferrales bacterium]